MKKRNYTTWSVVALALIGVMAGAIALAKPTPPPRPFNCKLVSCPPPACLEGEHTEVLPGQCCPVCVPD